MLTRKYYTIYKITNLVNNMIYIGCHITNNLNDNYLGSGTNIKKAVKFFGKNNFSKEILFSFDNAAEMSAKEAEIVNKKFILDENTYNIVIGGVDDFNVVGNVVVKDTKGDILMVNKNDPRYLSGELKYIKTNTVPVRDKFGNTLSVNKNDFRFVSGELESILKNKVCIIDTEGKAKIVDINDPKYISGEYVFICKGRQMSQDTRNKISKANKFHEVSNETKNKLSKILKDKRCWIFNEIFKQNKFVLKTEVENFLLKGWQKGQKTEYKQKAIRPLKYNKIQKTK